MQPRALAVVVAAVAVLSVFAGLALVSPLAAPAAARAVAAPAAAPHAQVAPQAGVGRVHTTDCFGGGFRSDFYVATYDDHVCFYAYDPVDTTAIVTITDQNATRDHVNSTAATFAVNTSSGYNYSYQWGLYYALPLDLAAGGWWNITITGASAGTTSASFYVHTYEVTLSSDAAFYLPGHTAKVFYNVQRTVNGGTVAGLTSIQLTAWYISTTTNHQVSLYNGAVSLPLAGIGNTTVTLPTDIADGAAVYVQVWANVTANGTTGSETSSLDLIVGGLGPIDLTLTGCQLCGTNFPDGSLVQVTAQVAIETPYSGSWPAAGLNVQFSFFANGAAVTSVPGNPPLNGTTNSQGLFSIVFLANATTFPDQRTATVDVNMTDPVYSQTGGSASADFVVLPRASSSALLSVQTATNQYYSGDTITATWQLGAAPGGSLAGWSADLWTIYGESYGYTVAQGSLNPTATSGSFSYTVPMSFTGGLIIAITAVNQTGTIYGETGVLVTAPTLLLTPNEAIYNPGDTVVVSVATDGSVLNGAALYGIVTAPNNPGGTPYFSGAVSNHQLSVKVPTLSPPSQLSFEVIAQGSGGVLAVSWSNVSLAYGLGLSAGIATASQYTDGSYQPGETIQIHYVISSINGAPLGKSYEIAAYFGGGLFGLTPAAQLSTTSTSGTFSVTVPSNAGTGSELLEVVATSSSCAVAFSPGCTASTTVGVQVDASPPVLGYELGAGSGLTVGWLILLVLILLLGLLLWRVARRPRSRSVVMAPESGSTPTTSSTGGGRSGGEGSSGPSASWSEPPASPSGSPGTGSTGSPPLPQPPESKN